MNITPGFYWARSEDSTKWELVEIRYKHHKRSRELFNLPDTLEVYSMGWDCPTKIESHVEYFKANLVDPYGTPYEGLYDEEIN